MKRLLIAALALSSISSFAQNHCTRNSSIVGTISAGLGKRGAYANLEAGRWGIVDNMGIYGGVMMYNVTKGYAQVYEIETTYKEPVIDPYIRLSYKIDGGESPLIFLPTAFISLKGNVGVSMRGYIPLGDYHMIAIEPNVSSKNGVGVNAVFTVSF